MATCYNPSLTEEPRNQGMKVIPLPPRETLLGWLESSGRFRLSEIDDSQDHKISESIDEILEPEIYASDSEEEQSE